MYKDTRGKVLWQYSAYSRWGGSIGIASEGAGSFFASPDATEDELHAGMLKHLHNFGLEWMPGPVTFAKVSE